ncbi:MAG: hypothetical protein ACR652_18140 [Methylocystis sp.]|uniref:hypothetical protein n=1 Tax=Methylocystis sp. TaxID=1911079 RepID=UPI003DA2076B
MHRYLDAAALIIRRESGVLVLTFCILIHTFGLDIVASLIQPEEAKKRRRKDLGPVIN